MSDRGRGVALRILLWIPWVIIALLCGILWWSLRQARAEVGHRLECRANLTQVYKALELYSLERGTLPNLAFYPESPQRGGDSLVKILRKFGLDHHAICPSAPDAVAWTGLTYVWNPMLNGKRFEEIQEPVWIVVDIQAVSTEVPPPHLGAYLVLYSDGSILETQDPPAVLRK